MNKTFKHKTLPNTLLTFRHIIGEVRYYNGRFLYRDKIYPFSITAIRRIIIERPNHINELKVRIFNQPEFWAYVPKTSDTDESLFK